MRRPPGFTLLELLTAMALAAMLYALVSYTTVQLSRTTRMASRAAEQKVRLVRACEQLRWQLRGLFVPGAEAAGGTGPPGSPTPSARPSPHPASSRRAPALANRALHGRRGPQRDREILLFRTNRLERGVGAAEVGYRILEDQETGQPYLAYRQYPWADPAGLRGPEEDPEAPWKVLSPEIAGLRLEFSGDGETWQREWDAPQPPKRIRATLVPLTGEPIQAEVVPGIETGRW